MRMRVHAHTREIRDSKHGGGGSCREPRLARVSGLANLLLPPHDCLYTPRVNGLEGLAAQACHTRSKCPAPSLSWRYRILLGLAGLVSSGRSRTPAIDSCQVGRYLADFYACCQPPIKWVLLTSDLFDQLVRSAQAAVESVKATTPASGGRSEREERRTMSSSVTQTPPCRLHPVVLTHHFSTRSPRVHSRSSAQGRQIDAALPQYASPIPCVP